ncbi:MAG: phosphodiester glycosidase family protein, partial [Nanoarchaeota archaeon]|nr:phosphodiester glycosidase family protein [Nanoarchaeota archaeon]
MRSQVSIFLLVVFIIAAAVVMSTMRVDDNSALKEGLYKKLTFSQANTNIRVMVEGCLSRLTQRGIELYGLDESRISSHIDTNMMWCLSYQMADIAKIYNVNFHSPVSSVRISEEMVSVRLHFPVTVATDDQRILVEDFSYDLVRNSSILIAGGRLPPGTVLTSEDLGFVLTAPAGSAYVLPGISDEELSIKLGERHFDGLSNSVVNGNVYFAEPSGTLFDPPVRISIRISKQDVRPEAKGLLKLGWYDASTDVWRTYPALPVEEDAHFYHYSALAGHFTPIAILYCGGKEKVPLTFSMGKLYKHPIEPVNREFWAKEGDKQYLLPELMGNATCEMKDTMEYEAGESCMTLVTDFDEDDSKADSSGYSYKSDSGTGITDTGIQEDCYDMCAEEAKKQLTCFYEGGCSDAVTSDKDMLFNPYEYELRMENESVIDKTSLVSGDGIKDGVTLTCAVERDEVTECVIETEYEDATVPEGYPKIRKMKPGIFATLKSYTYEKPESPGGSGIFEFDMAEDGDGCVDLDLTETDAQILYDTSRIFPFEKGKSITTPSDNLLCGSETECAWSLNPEDSLGQIHSGKNLVQAKVKDMDDPQAVAQAYLLLAGEGIRIKSEDPLVPLYPGTGGSGGTGTEPITPVVPGGGEPTPPTNPPGQTPTPQAGINYEKIEKDGVVYYVAWFDPRANAGKYYVTPWVGDQGVLMTTSQFYSKYGTEKGFDLAINGGGFDIGGSNIPGGPSMTDGVKNDCLHPDGGKCTENGATIYFSEDGKVIVGSDNKKDIPESEFKTYNMITGFTRLVVDGKINCKLMADPENCDDQDGGAHKASYDVVDPRTTFGIKEEEDGTLSRVILIVVDGRSAVSVGKNMEQLAKLNLEYEATQAVNMDGGGSSTLVVNGAVVNIPSDGSE